ncbi:MAG: RelA/SpoT [uncultured bacterium (gcode 4)]|uniref:RelA/SpoT n=1 Tax=uncultured bacterium (gcode 4) TaxID=1234023 RepID=K2GU41_9BACT|nr:MAG: RelA/SpoT [uncultured bacterium (gcode 4)]
MDTSEIEGKYKSIIPFYDRLGKNLKENLEGFLKFQDIPYVNVEYRIKEFKSLQNKITRKKYKNPLIDIEDFCGVRVVCYYQPDITKIKSIVEKEFNIQESSSKEESLGVDQFGYRSTHMIVTIRDEWLKAPPYRELKGLKAEIQIRSILMHSWAAISHKLSYKKEQDIPFEFSRRLSRLSALIELADEQFEALRNERDKYRKNLGSILEDETVFPEEAYLNIDTLQVLLDFYFNNRERKEGELSELIQDINNARISLADIKRYFQKSKPIIFDQESEDIFKKYYFNVSELNQIGLCRFILDITNDKFWKSGKGKNTPSKLRNEMKEKFEKGSSERRN